MKFPLIVCVVLMLGCQQQSVQGTHFRLEMNAQQQVVLFVVRNNEVSYGGGLNAIENKTTWDGSMNSKQRALFDKYISTLDISHGFIQEGVGKYSICIGWFVSGRTKEINAVLNSMVLVFSSL